MGFVIRAPMLVVLRLLGRMDGATLLAFARPKS
jgi:hypothetical protein